MAEATYELASFVNDARRVLSGADGDRQRVVDELLPLVRKILWNDELLDRKYRIDPAGGRGRYIYHVEPDGSLQIYVVEFVPGQPTPVHDHDSWGVIGICGGAQRTTRYQRLDDGSDPARAELRLIEETVLERGAAYPLLPPEDIHRIETVGNQPSYSLHVIGADLASQHRHIFDPETGAVTEVTGQRM